MHPIYIGVTPVIYYIVYNGRSLGGNVSLLRRSKAGLTNKASRIVHRLSNLKVTSIRDTRPQRRSYSSTYRVIDTQKIAVESCLVDVETFEGLVVMDQLA